MNKTYLIQTPLTYDELENAKEGDFIRYEMPSFCSGEYLALIHKDERGLYIFENKNFFKGAISWQLMEADLYSKYNQ